MKNLWERPWFTTQAWAAARSAAGLASCAVVSLLWACDPTPLSVTSTTDGASGSLRDVIHRANGTDAPSVRIQVPPGTYELTRCSADDDNAGGDLDITTSAAISLVATGPGVVIKQTCAGERVLDHRGAGVLTVTGITLTGGNTAEEGGAVRAQSLTLSNVTLHDNRARAGGGAHARSLTGQDVKTTDNTATERGGGLYVAGDATLTRSTLAGNAAAAGAGVFVAGTLRLSDTRVTANRTNGFVPHPWPNPPYSNASFGAGVAANRLEGERVTIDNNHLFACTESWHSPFAIVSRHSMGGGIYADTVSLTNATITNNTAVAPCAPPFGLLAIVSPPSGVAIQAGTVALDQSTIADNANGSTLSAGSLVSPRSIILEGTSSALLGPLADNGGFIPTRLPNFASAWIDAIPEADCPVKVDARGKSRPLGFGCDVGAVEVEPPAGYGAADLSLRFVEPPSSLVAGRSATWQLEVANKGPNMQVATVTVDTTRLVNMTSATASGGGTCNIISRNWMPPDSVECVFPALRAPGRETITLVGELQHSFETSFVDPVFTARVRGRGLLPPFEDDQAELKTPLSADAALRLEVNSVGNVVTASVFNTGPFLALGTAEYPIRIVFRPAAGVHAEPDIWFVPETGIFNVNTDAAAIQASYILTFDGTPPAQLGTFELLPGLNRSVGPTTLPVFYVPPDLSASVARDGDTLPSGHVPITIEIANLGPGAATNVSVFLRWSGEAFWTPEVGSFEGTPGIGYRWTIPSVAVGGRAVLRGFIAPSAEVLMVDATFAGDVDPSNNVVYF